MNTHLETHGVTTNLFGVITAKKQKVILVWINGTQFTNFPMDMEQQI
jgi:hypothetical protein